jgi:transcriptional regulator with XRE-family HTH domain
MRNEEKTAIGVYLRALWNTRGLSLREVEKQTSIRNALLCQIELGQVKRPSPTTLYKLAELYGVPYEELMGRTGYPVPSRLVGEMQSAQAVFKRLGTITEDEEQKLLDYLAFLRSHTK